MARQQKPERPASVPPEARWVAKEHRWEQGEGKGKSRHGPFRYWREDGSLWSECVLQAGVPHGPYKRFHPDGSLAEQGQYIEGAAHGLRVFIASEHPGAEVRTDEGLSPAIWRTEQDCELGQVVAVRHFDRQGNRVNSDGSPVPPRPRQVTERAEFRFEDQVWAELAVDKEGKRHGRLKSWARDGRLLEEADWEHGLRHGALRRFGPQGKVQEEGRYRRGERTGVFRFFGDDGLPLSEREFHGGALTGHAEEYDDAGQLELEETYVRGERHGVFRLKTQFWDPRVAEVQGSWRKNAPESPWTLIGHDGVPLALLEMGTTDGGLGSAPVFTDAAHSADVWAQQARAFEEHGHRNLALVAWARAASASARVAPLHEALGRLAIPVAGPRAEKLFREAQAQGAADALLSGLRCGASVWRVLQELAMRLDRAGRSRAALDLINAAILFAPDEVGLWFTRAQVLMSLGVVDAAFRDAHALAAADPESSELLLDLGRVLFCEFSFWPREARVVGEGAARVARDRDEVVEALQVLASRLSRTRAGLFERVRPGLPWLPPAAEALLPEGPLQLKVSRGRGKNKAVDQTRGLARSPEVPALLRAARSDWAALTWLCWAVGLEEVGLPKKLAPREGLGAAVAWTAQRLERCRERLEGRGEAGPRVEWEGLELAAMHPGLLAIAEPELRQVHAALAWLTDGEAPGLWHEPPKQPGDGAPTA